jgi:NAD(P)-dependent dehydrogenase (short-subunit alcohol dehydrogenase family)
MAPEKTVVITGASTGIGRACALHMDRLGWRTFAGVREESDAASLRAAASDRLTPIFLDVSQPRSVMEAEQLVSRAVGAHGLSGLVNNAGIAYGGPVEFLDVKEVRRAFDVNFFGVITVTQVFMPLLRVGRGRIINMSSISGWIAAPFLSPYSSSKFALEALSDALRVELHPWGIQVAVIEPGAIDTPIWKKGGEIINNLLGHAPKEEMALYSAVIQEMKSSLKPHGIPPERVAGAVEHALTSRRPKTRYAIGRDGRLGGIFRLLPDRLRDRIYLSHLPKWG